MQMLPYWIQKMRWLPGQEITPVSINDQAAKRAAQNEDFQLPSIAPAATTFWAIRLYCCSGA